MVYLPTSAFLWYQLMSWPKSVQHSIAMGLCMHLERPTRCSCYPRGSGTKNHIWYGFWALIPYWQSRWTLWLPSYAGIELRAAVCGCCAEAPPRDSASRSGPAVGVEASSWGPRVPFRAPFKGSLHVPNMVQNIICTYGIWLSL